MIEIPKSELIPLMTDYYRKQLQESAYRLYSFEQKYKCPFPAFEKRFNERNTEDFGEWDDYIAWKAHIKSAAALSERIQQIEDGLFTIA